MNIFFLHLDASTSAKYYFNKHCIKIILEIAQMLYTAHWMTQPDEQWIETHSSALNLAPYRKTHFNHPTCKWVRQHLNNYMYACRMGLELCYEYTRRYHKIHKSQERLEWLFTHPPTKFQTDKIDAYLATKNIPDGCTAIPLAMPTEFHTEDAIHSYRLYYIKNKKEIAQSEQVYQQLASEFKIST